MTTLRRSNVTVDAILFREIQCKKMDILMFKQRFQCEFGWNKVTYAKTTTDRQTITYVCFIALTLIGLVFKHLARQMLMHEKNMFDPYNNNTKRYLDSRLQTSLINIAFHKCCKTRKVCSVSFVSIYTGKCILALGT